MTSEENVSTKLWEELQKQFKEHYAEIQHYEQHGEHSSDVMRDRYDLEDDEK